MLPLRVDAGDGSPVKDYRIENGYVEERVLDFNADDSESDERWERLTHEQLASHVMRNTAVARWLRRRLGLHRLIRACQPGPAAMPVRFDREPSQERRVA